jgi:uncharacterized membrane protein
LPLTVNDNLGTETELELLRQREYLEDAHEKVICVAFILLVGVILGAVCQVGIIDSLTIAARRTVNRIQYEHYRKKFCLWAIIIALACANLGLIIKMLRNGGRLY